MKKTLLLKAILIILWVHLTGLHLFASDGKQMKADLIITDLIMPEKEGIETITELRRDFPDVKIIAISGGGRIAPEVYLRMARSLGALRTFAKPIERKEIIETVQELLHNEK